MPPLSEQALVAQVSGPSYERVDQSVWAPFPEPRQATRPYRVVLIDCGVKHNIARSLSRRGLETVLVPYDTTAGAIMALAPDGVVIGNGPGDPDGDPSLKGTIETLRALIEGPVRRQGLPLAGVCLGHQVMGLAIGGSTSRLKFGHRGANHPVQDLQTGASTSPPRTTASRWTGTASRRRGGSPSPTSTSTTARWRGSPTASCPSSRCSTTPRPAPGPQDNQYLFDRFVDALEGRHRGHA